jgi:hypothetical protein
MRQVAIAEKKKKKLSSMGMGGSLSFKSSSMLGDNLKRGKKNLLRKTFTSVNVTKDLPRKDGSASPRAHGFMKIELH